MLEMYLFINPIDPNSLTFKTKVLALKKEMDKEDIYVRIIPLLNPQLVSAYIQKNNLPRTLEFRNQLFQTIYDACLDFKTVQFRGLNKSRMFLHCLQKAQVTKDFKYTDTMRRMILSELGLDYDHFIEERTKKSVSNYFNIDQKISHEMGVHAYDTGVLFNYHLEQPEGILFNSETSFETLKKIANRHARYDTKTLSLHLL